MSERARISSRRVYSWRVLNLDIDQVRFPNGKEGELEMIRHPGASAVVPFLSDPAGDDPQILLLRQYRYAAESWLYEIPAGLLGPGEDPETCARRELAEETGIVAEFTSATTLAALHRRAGELRGMRVVLVITGGRADS